MCANPAESATTPCKPGTGVGLNAVVRVPSPSCPNAFQPQHCTVPPVISAHVWYQPEVIAVAPTSTGEPPATSVEFVVPLPS